MLRAERARNLKAAAWLFLLAVIYAASNVKPSAELLFLFCGIYAFLTKEIKSSVAVALSGGLLMSGLGGYGFVYSVLSCCYLSFFCLWFNSKNKAVLKLTTAVFFICFLFEGTYYALFCLNSIQLIQALTRLILPFAFKNSVWFVLLYFAVRKSFAEKAKYIFYVKKRGCMGCPVHKED